MNPLGFLSVFALLSTIAQADRVLIVGTKDGLVHEAVGTTNSAQFSHVGLAELALDAFGIATGNIVSLSETVSKVQSPVQADIFEHIDAYTMMFMDMNDVSIVDSLDHGIQTGYHKVFELERGTSPKKLSTVIATELHTMTKEGTPIVKCIGNAVFCQSNVFTSEVVQTVEYEHVFKKHTFLDPQNNADIVFAQEIALLHQLTDSIVTSPSKALYVIQFSSFQSLDPEKRKPARLLVTKQVRKFLASLYKAYPLSGAQIIASTKSPVVRMTQISDTFSYGRMLLSSTGSSAAGDAEVGINGTANGNSTTNDLSMEEIAEYQIILWTSVILGSILTLVLFAMCNMAPPRDSLLYAKFITSNNGRKYD